MFLKSLRQYFNFSQKELNGVLVLLLLLVIVWLIPIFLNDTPESFDVEKAKKEMAEFELNLAPDKVYSYREVELNQERATYADFDPNGHNRTALQGQTVLFDFDKSDVRASEREKLKVAKEYLDKNPTHRLLLEGHCDWRGTAEYNLGLGDRRAAAVRKYLQSLGVPAERVETLSKGSLEAAKNADDATMAKDRRVDLVVVNPAAAAPKAF